MESRASRRKKPMKLWLKIFLIALTALVLGVGAYAYSIYYKAQKTVEDKMHEPIDAIDTGLAKQKLADTERINVLLLGIDSVEGESGRSDAVMILSLHPKTDDMKLISIPRDTRVPIIGKGKDDKINHAYAFGGNKMAIDTVEDFLGIDLDYYISINMSGFKELVDQLGGITVYNDIAWQEGKYNFNFGPINMDGDQTMAFVRMRKKDPAGDFGRTKRQRQVIQGIINKGASVGSVTKIHGVIDILGKNLATNMDFADMKSLLTNYRDTRKNFGDYQVQGKGTTINGIYYYIVENDEVVKVREMITEE